jgi:hypothetical protein
VTDRPPDFQPFTPRERIFALVLIPGGLFVLLLGLLYFLGASEPNHHFPAFRPQSAEMR